MRYVDGPSLLKVPIVQLHMMRDNQLEEIVG